MSTGLAAYDRHKWVWQESATCRTSTTPQDYTDVRADSLTPGNWTALKTCRRVCPVRSECFAFIDALPPQERQGMIAGGVIWSAHGKQIKQIPRQTWEPVRPHDIAPCGTVSALRRHNRNKEPACPACAAGRDARKHQARVGAVPPEVLTLLPDRLLERRKLLGVGREQAARQIGVSVATVFLIENRRRYPRLPVLTKMLMWLDQETTR